MGARDCMTQDNKGNIIINCTLMPDKGFLDVIKTKEIANAKIMSRQDKKNAGFRGGEPDIILSFSSGGSQRISRQQLCAEYRHSSARPINLAILRAGQNYLVYKSCNERFKAFKIPSNCKVNINGKVVDSNYYIVCKVDESGNIIKESMTPISTRIFRKQFKVPMQAVLKRNMGKGINSGAFKLFSKQNTNRTNEMQYRAIPRQSNVDTSALGINPSNINIKSVKEINSPEANSKFSGNKGVNTFRNKPNINNNVNNYKYTVINRVVDINNKLLGFAVKEIDSGRIKNLTPQELSLLCGKKLVDNVMIVRKDNGQAFLKGNGMRLETLPSVIL